MPPLILKLSLLNCFCWIVDCVLYIYCISLPLGKCVLKLSCILTSEFLLGCHRGRE